MVDVLFICEHLPHEGGIGTALINQLYALDRSKYRLFLCVICKYIDPSITIPADVKVLPGVRLMEDHIVNYAKRKKEFSVLRRAEMLTMKLMRRAIGFTAYEKIALRHFSIKKTFDVAIAYSNDICVNGTPVSGGSDYCLKHCVKAKRRIAWIHNEVARQGFTHEYCLKAFRDYDFVVNVSMACKKMFDEMAAEYAAKSRCVYNLVNEDRINALLCDEVPSILSDNKDKFRIVTVARIEEGQKKISRILECVKRLLMDGRNDFLWVVLGDGPDFRRFKEDTDKLGLNQYLLFLGITKNPYIYMNNVDVMVLPSLYESFGIVIKEAMSVGCPVITTSFEASAEIIKDGENGLICENSASGVYDALRKVMDEPKLLAQMRTFMKHDHGSINDLAMWQFDQIVLYDAIKEDKNYE